MRKPDDSTELLMVTAAAVIGLGGLAATSADAAIIVDAVPTDTGASIDRTIDRRGDRHRRQPEYCPARQCQRGSRRCGLGRQLVHLRDRRYRHRCPRRWPWQRHLRGGKPVRISRISTRESSAMLANSEAGASTLARFTFEYSTDGTNFSAISMSGTVITGAGLDADWTRVSATPTDLSSLGQVTHLRIGMQPKTPGGDWWHQQFGAVSLDQTLRFPSRLRWRWGWWV
jgi:hypothetical protein